MNDELIQKLRTAGKESFICGDLMNQAADAIEELGVVVRTQKAVLDKFPRWIPVTERLPDSKMEVLVSSGMFSPLMEVAFWDGLFYSAWDGKTEVVAVTHWMPLPQPPKEKAT